MRLHTHTLKPQTYKTSFWARVKNERLVIIFSVRTDALFINKRNEKGESEKLFRSGRLGSYFTQNNCRKHTAFILFESHFIRECAEM